MTRWRDPKTEPVESQDWEVGDRIVLIVETLNSWKQWEKQLAIFGATEFHGWEAQNEEFNGWDVDDCLLWTTEKSVMEVANVIGGRNEPGR